MMFSVFIPLPDMPSGPLSSPLYAKKDLSLSSLNSSPITGLNSTKFMDGIVYTIVASLGFAVVENMLYVIRTGIVVALLRAVTAVPLHALASGLMGYYLGVAKFITDKTSERKLFIKGLGLAILVHGLYNFFLFSVEFFGGWIALGIIPVLLLSGIFLQNKIKKALSSDLEMGRVI
jgi:protease PrsW